LRSATVHVMEEPVQVVTTVSVQVKRMEYSGTSHPAPAIHELHLRSAAMPGMEESTQVTPYSVQVNDSKGTADSDASYPSMEFVLILISAEIGFFFLGLPGALLTFLTVALGVVLFIDAKDKAFREQLEKETQARNEALKKKKWRAFIKARRSYHETHCIRCKAKSRGSRMEPAVCY
jgi:hypothetical protein